MTGAGMLLIAGVGALVGGAALYAYEQSKDEEDNPNDVLDLPQPSELECTDANTVWNATQDTLAGNHTATELRNAANILKHWEQDGNQFCDDKARAMAITCAALLEARAQTVEDTPPGQPVPDVTQGASIPPLPFPFPGSTYYSGYGYCPEGAVIDMATGLCDFTPMVSTSGCYDDTKYLDKPCCDSCARGGECEGCDA